MGASENRPIIPQLRQNGKSVLDIVKLAAICDQSRTTCNTNGFSVWLNSFPKSCLRSADSSSDIALAMSYIWGNEKSPCALSKLVFWHAYIMSNPTTHNRTARPSRTGKTLKCPHSAVHALTRLRHTDTCCTWQVVFDTEQVEHSRDHEVQQVSDGTGRMVERRHCRNDRRARAAFNMFSHACSLRRRIRKAASFGSIHPFVLLNRTWLTARLDFRLSALRGWLRRRSFSELRFRSASAPSGTAQHTFPL